MVATSPLYHSSSWKMGIRRLGQARFSTVDPPATTTTRSSHGQRGQRFPSDSETSTQTLTRSWVTLLGGVTTRPPLTKSRCRTQTMQTGCWLGSDKLLVLGSMKGNLSLQALVFTSLTHHGKVTIALLLSNLKRIFTSGLLIDIGISLKNSWIIILMKSWMFLTISMPQSTCLKRRGTSHPYSGSSLTLRQKHSAFQTLGTSMTSVIFTTVDYKA